MPKAARTLSPAHACAPCRSATGRGFTLIEVMLAAALGSLVLFAAFGIITTVDMSDRRAQRRFEQAVELQRARRAFQDSFSSLVMSTENRMRPVAGAVPSGDGSAGASNATVERERIYIPPRVILEQDFSQIATFGARAGRGGSTPQRLEVVVLNPPALDARGGMVVGQGTPQRGVFELRPEPRRESDAEPERQTWELTWRRLPPRQKPKEGEAEEIPPPPGPPMRVMGDLVECRWEAFRGREFKREFEAAKAGDLPAYFRMTMRTAQGLYAEWLFEVGWHNGPETPEETTPESGGATPGDDAAAGGDGSPARAEPRAAQPTRGIRREGAPQKREDTGNDR